METQVYPFTVPQKPPFTEKGNGKIGRKAMELHYKAYFEKSVGELNRVLLSFPQYQTWTLKQLADNLRMLPEDLAFFAGNVYAHWLYFNGLAEEKPASEKIQAVFCLNFGSMAEWKARMKRETAKLYGAGWIFVVADAVGALKITRTQNNDIPVGSPVLAIDLWEHAYLLEPGLDKEGYLDAVLSAIDWEEAEQRFCNAAR